MTKTINTFNTRSWRSFVGVLALVCAMSAAVMAQTADPYTPGGTTIANTATSTYSDGTDSYETTSNTVSVTVTNIAGLAITPDAGSRANVVRGQAGVDFLFTVTNTGNFTNQVVFKELGASIIKTGPATVTAAVIDVNKDGLIDGGDTDLLDAGDSTSANVLQDGTLFVIVRVTVDANAAGGSTINIQLGDAVGGTPWDNKVLAASAADVRTATAGTTNGQEEARGDVSATVDNTGSVLLGPSGFPGAFGSGTDTSNDYTNRSVNTGIATVAPGGNTTAQGIVVFTNSVQNTGNASDTFTFTAPTIPAGFTVEVSVNGLGTDYVNVNTSPTLVVAMGATSNILVRVTAPAGNVVLTAYPTIIRATSLTTLAASDDTIDRLYTGYLSLAKSQIVANATGRGGATEAVPGATIAYVVAYDNVTTSGGTNNSTISASSIVLIDPVPANTDFAVGSATSNPSAGITVVIAYSDDAGATWTYAPVSGAGGAPAGYDRNVNRVRFTLTGPMAPAAALGDNGFTVRIR